MKTIIGIKGKSGSGKDTVANYLIEKYGFQKLALADSLKEIVSIISGWSLEQLRGDTLESRVFRETVKHPDFGLTGRQLLQKIGTDCLRDHFDSWLWIKILQRRIEESESDKIVITDLRFENEIRYFQEKGIKIFHLERGAMSGTAGYPSATRDVCAGTTGYPSATRDVCAGTAFVHKSEDIIHIPEEIVVENNGTFEELYQKIDDLIYN